MNRYALTILLSILSLSGLTAKTWDQLVSLQKISMPEGIDPQIGALGTLPNGDIIAAFHRGEIMIYSKAKKAWQPWGSGLHEPLGMHVENQHSIIVVQRAELTRISDTDKDGQADSYQALCSGWGMSGNYHEFAFGAAKAPDGSFFVGLGTASGNGGVRPEIRGEWKTVDGLTLEKTQPGWIRSGRRGFPRMYARVPYRGWIIKIDPRTGKITPYASGLRTPHGVHVDAKGEVYVNDNQGDWLGMSKLYKIEKGKFYGHADSLLWTDGWDRGVPANLPPAELDKLRSKSVCYLPQGDLANSPTQILTLPEKGFGPYGGSMIMGEMNQPRLVRYMPDTVNGHQQGAVISFFQHSGLGIGSSKLTLGQDSTIYVGKTHLSWAGAEGLLALKYSQKPHLAITGVQLTAKGFKVELNAPADKKKITLTGSRYGLSYHKKYGSPKIDPTGLKASSIKVNGKFIYITLSKPLVAGQIYDLKLDGISSGKLGGVTENRFFYTVHEVRR